MKGLPVSVLGTGMIAVLALGLPEPSALAQQIQPSHTKNQPSSQDSSAALDRMIAARQSQRELAQYVFSTHGCKNCHTRGHHGKLGFTEVGKQKAKGFEGCISMLTAMTVIVQVPEGERRPEQRQKAARFEDFGCTACHKITPGKMDLTEVGAKLAHLHVGCVDVEKLMSTRTGPQN
jgi:cytochrome c551/c552